MLSKIWHATYSTMHDILKNKNTKAEERLLEPEEREDKKGQRVGHLNRVKAQSIHVWMYHIKAVTWYNWYFNNF